MLLNEVNDDIWNWWSNGHFIVVTTNGFVKNNGACVMGRGISKQAAEKFERLPFELGALIKQFGNIPFQFDSYGIISMPVKRNWWEKANLELIESSAKKLVKAQVSKYPICLPRPGCSNGKLDWKDVKPILEKYLDPEKFLVVDLAV